MTRKSFFIAQGFYEIKKTRALSMPLCAFSPWPAYGRPVLPSCYKYRPSPSPLSSVVCTSKSTVTSLSCKKSSLKPQHGKIRCKFSFPIHFNSFSHLCVCAVESVVCSHRFGGRLNGQRSLRCKQRLFTIRTPGIPFVLGQIR